MNRQQRRAAAKTAGGPHAKKLQGAVAHHQAGRLDEAARLYGQVLALDPRNADALHLSGLVLYQRGDAAGAAERIGRAIAADAANALYHGNLGNALRALDRPEEAVAAYRRALALAPDYYVGYNNLGIALHDLGLMAEAETSYRLALQLAPQYADAHSNLGLLLCDLYRPDEAVAQLEEALKLDPANAVAMVRLGNVAKDRGDHAQALDLFRRARELRPDLEEAEAREYYTRLAVCDWSALDDTRAFLARHVAGGRAGGGAGAGAGDADPFAALAVPGLGPMEFRALAEQDARRKFAKQAKERAALGWRWAREAKPRLRLGYLSADFHNHATAALLVEAIELHDRSRFDVVAYSLGPDDGSPMRARIRGAFDAFHELFVPVARDAAERIHRDGIDILIDLKGYARDSRPDIVALRPAPIQVNYLGYPGTMGADFIDYIVADDFICPPGSDAHYTEAVARLPDTYQPNDRKRAIAPAPPTRAECGLPPGALVFCSFNISVKIAPDIFDVWMSLLRDVPASVLWLIDDNALASENLRRAAAARGIDSGRLVFAPRAAPDVHLARHVHADLFLDTLPYNAHTTASDALWAGLPMITCPGATFAGRVAGSLLRAAGLPECIAGDLGEYRRRALALAGDPGALAALKRKLAAARDTCRLFDTPRYTRNLEGLYEAMWRNWLDGGPPKAIVPDTK